MTFTKKKIQKRIINTSSGKKRVLSKNKNGGKGVFKVIMMLFLIFLLVSSVFAFVLYDKYLADLPSVKTFENFEVAETSVIYDRNGVELYKIYKEKRTYVPFEEINTNMINALVAGEDKRYWENPGVDLLGMVRAVFNYAIGKTDKVEGTSTISQQLIRNTIIANERKLERKIKEIYLSYKLNQGISKEKILELYLNKISFGSNAFGIEQAAKTYFAKNAKDLSILESSILASLPKGPTYYSPYNHPDRLVGYPYTYLAEDTESTKDILTKSDVEGNEEILSLFTDFLKNLKATRLVGSDKLVICGLSKTQFKTDLSIDNDGCTIVKYSGLLAFLNGIRIGSEEKFLEYQTGRKDFILGRMLEDEYIDFNEYRNALLDSITLDFQQAKEDIKAPHFVFYVKEYLEEKYGSEVVSMGGLHIFTTLDYKLQEQAEQIIEKYGKINETKYDASNAALISLDNKTGGIISMVGGRDYFDTANKGNVNIITSKLQPGSTFKSFVYSMALYKNKIGSKTPVYDVETEFPNYTPANFDGKFMGKMNISTALDNSRNIPAIKMLYLAGGELEIVKFMRKLGVSSLKAHGQYGAPLALGTGEMTPLELATAYGVFANLGNKVEISPILRIVDSKGNVIKSEEEKNKSEQVISEDQSYLITHILSDTTSRPAFWNTILSLSGRQVAAKTGTSTKQYIKNGKKQIFPSNLWTAGYTPQITTVAWVGNTDGRELNVKGNGLEGAGPIWRDYMELAHKDKTPETWIQPAGVVNVNISTITGLLPSPETTNNSFVTESLFINKPTEYDNSMKTIKVDALCNGKVTDATPIAAIKEVTLLGFHSLIPENEKWELPVQKWVKSDAAKSIYGNLTNVVTDVSDEICERDLLPGSIVIKSKIENNDTLVVGDNYIELAYKSNNPIIQVDVLLGDKKVDEISLESKTLGIFKGTFKIPDSYVNQSTTLTLRAVDSSYYSSEDVKTITVVSKDKIPPVIDVTNPSDLSIKLYQDSVFNLRGTIIDSSPIRTINIYIDGEAEKIGITDRVFSYPIGGYNLTPGFHTIRIDAIDNSFNKGTQEVKIEILER